jgi:glycosyltransferase involved in cell wall biosynthesis
LKVILARSTLTGSVSGADEAVVRYALHLQRAGHLHSVTMLYQPPLDNPYYLRLIEAGVAINCISRGSATGSLLTTALRLAKGLRLISNTAVAASTSAVTQSLPRRALYRLSLLIPRRRLSQARKLFAATGADLVHIVGSDLGAMVLIPAAHQASLPVLLHELGTADHLPELRLHYTSLRRALRHCTEMAALSPALAAAWRVFYALPRPVRVLPLIYDDTTLRGRRPCADGSITFGYAARLEQGKGLMFLLDAFARVHEARPEARLVIAGIGPLAKLAHARAAALGLRGCCEFVGYTPEADKPRMLTEFDAFVLPTLAEGTPNSIVEAMMFGLAVVASGVGGIPDMLAGGAGLLVPPRDVEALASAMLRLIDDVDLRVELGRRARLSYERLFRSDVVLEALVHEYRRVVTVSEQGSQRVARQTHPWVQDDAAPERAAALPTRAVAAETA